MSPLPTIRRKLAWLVAACLLPGMLAAPLLLDHLYRSGRAQLEQQAIQTVRALVRGLDRDLASAQAAVQVLATSPHLQADDLAAFHAQAGEVLRTFPERNFVLTDATAQERVNLRQPFGAPLPRRGNPDQVRRVFESGQPVVSDLYRGGLLGLPVVAIDTPVRRGGAVVYSLATVLRSDHLGRILADQRLPPGWIAAIFDSTGTIVARTHEPERFVGLKGTPILIERMRHAGEGLSENNTVEGIPVFGAFTHSSVANWSVAIGIPKEILFADLRRSLALVGLAVLAVLATGFGLAWMLGGQIARSVRALTAPALALGSGDAVPIPSLHVREADEVATALGIAAGLLLRRTAERDQARQEETATQRLLQDVIDASTSIIYAFDRDGRCLLVNAACRTLFARPVHDILGKDRQDFLPAEVAAIHRANDLAVFASGRPMTLEEGNPEPDGLHTYLSIKFPIRDGHGVLYGVGGISTDITGRKAAEAELERHRHHLEALVAERTQALADALAEVQRSEERYRTLFTRSKVPMLLIDPADGAIVDANLAAGAYYGHAVDTLRSMRISDINTLSRDAVAAEMERARTEGLNHFLFRHRLAGGDIRDVEVHSGPVEMEGRTLLYSIVHDVTGRRLADEAIHRLNRQLQDILAAASEVAIIATDCDGLITLFNRGAQRMLGYDERQVVGRQTPALFHATEEVESRGRELSAEFGCPVDGFRVFAEKAERDGHELREWTYVRKDGSRLTVSLAVTPVRASDGRITGYLGVAQDITARRSLEEELRRSNADLEQFAYVASHDLRQPLRMVSSYLALIERRLAGTLDAECREFLGFARDGAIRMDRLILDLLEYSRVGRHGAMTEAVTLAEIADDACRSLAMAIDEAAATVDIATAPAVVAGNRAELVRLFQNLIANAVKYRHPERTPLVAIEWQRRSGEWRVAVKDNGIGIAPEYFAEVFKIFRRLHTSTEYEGSGIGLAVCQRIVENHGGRIWVESEPGVGSTFRFTLPTTPRVIG
ncbi:MAG: PAS domain S-box protein [Magnetospirillum sp.]|nr:PAS domain S-box protein [Magnetospirillum sp.]